MATATVKPMIPFEPTVDAENLKKSMKVLGTNEDVIINILSKRTSLQRQEIIRQYRLAYDRDLVKDLKHHLYGKFEDVVVALMTPLPEYLAHELHRAMKGKGTNERVLIEILCTNNNKTIKAIKEAYEEHHGKSLKDAIKDETSGDFKKLLEDLVSCEREEEECRPELASEIAKDLFDAGKNRIGTDEEKLRSILTTYSYSTLRCAFQEYDKMADNPLDHDLRKELSGDFRDAMLAVYLSIYNPAIFFAYEIHSTMKGMKTRDRSLIRLIVSRCEVDMKLIKTEFHNMFEKTLEKAIKGDTHGDYKKVLLALIE
ncbi:annexin B9-like [Palaemon carinicauda]|uniref:annexin B9-like n=1 Tax=Palaemon carinicauda TaxID=392227 RepID=UPI0035B61374